MATIEIKLIAKDHSYFKTEIMRFKVNNQTTFKQVRDTIFNRESQWYDFIDLNYNIIDSNTPVLNQPAYGISKSSFDYDLRDLVLISNSILNN